MNLTDHQYDVFLLQFLPQMTWTNLPDGTVNFYNQKWYTYTGLTFDQTKEWGWKAVVHPDDLANTLKNYTEALASGSTFEVENRYRRADGTYRWHLNRALPIRNEQGDMFLWVGTATDIEDIKHAEKELSDSRKTLERSELHFKNLVMGATFPIAVFRGEELIAEIANDAYLLLVGKTKEEFIGRPLFESLQEIKPLLGDIIKNVMLTGVTFKAQEFGITMNKFGKDVFGYYSFIYEPVRDLNGKINGFMATATDITDQVKARKSVEETGAHLQLLRDTVPAMIFYLDEDQRYRSYNIVFEKWFHVGPDEALGKTVREFIGEEAYQNAFTHLSKAYSGTQSRYETHAPSRMDAGRWLSIVYTPHFSSEGKVIGLIVHATDVTQTKLIEISLRESESRFRSLIEESRIATCLFTGKEMKIAIANDIMLAKWEKDRSVIGKRLEDALPKVKSQPMLQILEKVFSTGKTFEAKAMSTKSVVDGVFGTYHFDVSYTAIRGEQDEIYGVMYMAVDVTTQVESRKLIEKAVIERTKELAESNNNLLRSNAELEQFAYIASHDLQEPIRKIGTFLEMLENSLDGVSEKSNILIAKLKASTERITYLIRDVLAFSTVSQGTTLFREVDLNKIIAEVQNDFELQIEEKKAVIECSTLPKIQAIQSQILQLFSNLMSNSLKYTHQNVAPHISISASELTAENIKLYPLLNPSKKYYGINFVDQGIGFEQEHSERIFKIFQRLHGKTAFEGTGIGLSLCRKIVQNHSGEISAVSSLNKGTAFIIILPEN